MADPRTIPSEEDAYWRAPVDGLLADLASRSEGLSSHDAAERLRRYGRNIVITPAAPTILRKIGKRFADPLVAILLVAAAVSSLTGDVASFFIILVVVALSISLDVIQEHRAETAAEALKRSVAIHADVLRDQNLSSLPVDEIVPGDVITLTPGDLVPADGILLSARALHVNEALMTGEPFPVEKRSGQCQSRVPAEAFNAVFAGTSVVNGEGTMLAVRTGKATRFGGVATALAGTEMQTAFERGIHQLALLIVRLTFFLVLFVLLVNALFGRPILESFLFSVALAVGLAPELLPMITTVTLSRGALRLARKKAIVKRLASIHDLGAMDVLCTDKTGTLTEAKIAIAGHPAWDGRDNDRVLTLAAVNSRLGAGIRSPLDKAILSHCAEADLSAWHKIDEVPFDFERRRMSVLVEKQGEQILIVKGAVEEVLERCEQIGLDEKDARPFNSEDRVESNTRQNSYADQGYRVLAVAWKRLNANTVTADDERQLVLAGFCLFFDPPKASAGAAIQRLSAAAVAIKVISGDHPAVVRQVATGLGIPPGDILTGEDVAALTDAALIARVQTANLFGRVSPDQKTRIIRALQARGHTVGFLGDGVNDAPAILRAEVGLSVEGATDAARGAADIILLNPDLSLIADGVAEGRRTFANILKYVRMGTSSNFGNMLSMALASLLLPFLPLLPIQILLNNLLYDFSEIGIPFDYVDSRDLGAPRHWDMHSILKFTIIMGSLSTLFDLCVFFLLLKVLKVDPNQFRTAWFAESLLTQILVIFVIRSYQPLSSDWPHPILVTSSLLGIAAATVLLLTPLRQAFAFVPISGAMALAIGVPSILYLAAAERIKHFAAEIRK